MMAIAYINDPALAKSVKALTAMLSSKKKMKKIKKKFGALGSMGLKMAMANNKQKKQAELEQKKKSTGLVGCLKRQVDKLYRCTTCQRPPPSMKKKRVKTKSEISLTECLGEEYTISSADDTFQYANPIDSAVAGTDRQRKKRTVILYGVAILNLLIYIFIVENYAAVQYRSQPWGIAGWVVILDFCMWLRMRKGTCDWGPGKTVLLIAMTRGALSLFSGDLWLVGIGLSFFVVGNVLAIDIVNTRLKTLNAYEIGAVAFFGATKSEKEIDARNDYASTPEWNLTTLSCKKKKKKKGRVVVVLLL